MALTKGKFNPRHHFAVMDPDMDSLVHGIQSGNLVALSRAITLLESDQKEDRVRAQQLLLEIPVKLRGWKIGVSGAPGSGKSTLIEQLGLQLCQSGHKVAVLAIDPTSSLSGGSILGDKTRMENLSRHPNAFIRPSPTKGILGGVSAYTREVSQLCAMAGYDIILIETVGVGQSEYSIRDIVDFMILVLSPGAGDDLQGIKRGILEVADLYAINKCDGELEKLANKTYQEIKNTQQSSQKPILKISALEDFGIDILWNESQQILKRWSDDGKLESLRMNQDLNWLYRIFELRISKILWESSVLAPLIENQKKAIQNRECSPMQAAFTLIKFVESILEKQIHDK